MLDTVKEMDDLYTDSLSLKEIELFKLLKSNYYRLINELLEVCISYDSMKIKDNTPRRESVVS